MRNYLTTVLVGIVSLVFAVPAYAYWFDSYLPSFSNGRTCLYTNASGECMIEQYWNPQPVYSSAPVYDRQYLDNERRYSERYNYRDYDYDYCDRYNRYDRYCDRWDSIDDDDDFDYDRYFGDDDDDD